MSAGSKDYKTIAAAAQQKVLDLIPPEHITPTEVKSQYTGNSFSFITRCGILSEKQVEITQMNASELLALIHTGQLKAVQVVKAFCTRAALAHQLVNCLTDFFPEEALAEASRLDEEFERTGKPVGPLHGMPMAVKDIMNVKGKPTTWAWVEWYDRPPSTFDASPARVMRDAGAIFFARTTMPQTGMALETVSPLWGRTLNPYNPAFGSGG